MNLIINAILEHPTVCAGMAIHAAHLGWPKVKAAAAWLSDNGGCEGLFNVLRRGKSQPPEGQAKA
jgi:hypothetical protein